MSKLRFFFACLMGFVGLALILRLTKPAPSPSPSRRVLVLPRTWHLTGWRRIAGKQVPWEIWGQNQPMFCYERIGESRRLVQNEKESLITPPLLGHARVLLTDLPALPNNRLFLLQHWADSEEDPETGLPLHYRMHTGGTRQSDAELTARYNLPIPKEMRSPLTFSGYCLNLARSLRPLPQQPNVAVGQGITVRGQVLSQDTEGNLRVRIVLQPGQPDSPRSLPFTLHRNEFAPPFYPRVPSTPGPNTTQVMRPSGSGMGGGGGIPMSTASLPPRIERNVQDDQGKDYILSYLPPIQEQAATEYCLIRVTPRTPGAPPPKTITLTVSADLHWVTELTAYFRPFMFQRVNARLTLTLPNTLPTRKISPDEQRLFVEKRKQYQKNLELWNAPTVAAQSAR